MKKLLWIHRSQTTKKFLWGGGVFLAVLCITYFCCGQCFDSASICFEKNADYSNEPNRGPKVYRMAIDDSPELKQIENWIAKKRWWPSLTSYLPQRRISSDLLRVTKVESIIVLEIRKPNEEMWRQFTCRSDNEIKRIFDSLQHRYDTCLQHANDGCGFGWP